jgi:hypothetical protein
MKVGDRPLSPLVYEDWIPVARLSYLPLVPELTWLKVYIGIYVGTGRTVISRVLSTQVLSVCHGIKQIGKGGILVPGAKGFAGQSCPRREAGKQGTILIFQPIFTTTLHFICAAWSGCQTKEKLFERLDIITENEREANV